MSDGPGQSPAVDRWLAIAEHAVVSMQAPGTPSMEHPPSTESPPSPPPLADEPLAPPAPPAPPAPEPELLLLTEEPTLPELPTLPEEPDPAAPPPWIALVPHAPRSATPTSASERFRASTMARGERPGLAPSSEREVAVTETAG